MTGPVRSATSGQRPQGRSRTVGSHAGIAGTVLDELLAQGDLADIDRHFAAMIADLDRGGGPGLALAAALASAWTRDGHACVALPDVAGREWPRAGAVRLPELDAWIGALRTSPVVAGPEDAGGRPLVLDDRGRLYLERLWTAEQAVAAGLRGLAAGMACGPWRTGAAEGSRGVARPERDGSGSSGPDTGRGDGGSREPAPMPAGARLYSTTLEAELDRFFPDTASDDPVRVAARTAICRRICVVSGGPGTGKTTIAAAIVALLLDLGLVAPGRIALAAPTGKAAARLQEAVRGRHRELVSRAPALEGYEAQATTVHRWLLRRERGGRSPRPVDALILDEGSMVDLTLMARVIAALPAGARLVMLGDASQLASVQPGAVFADMCRAGAGSVAAGLGNGSIGSDAGTRKAGGAGIGAATGLGEDSSATASSSGSSRGSSRGSSGLSPGSPRGSPPLASCVITLERNWRFDPKGGVGRLAAAVVRGDASAAIAALVDPSDDAIELRALPDAGRFERLATRFADERFAPALRETRALRAPGEGSTPLASFRVLCAHRVGQFGAVRFNRLVERRLRALGLVRGNDAFYPGRPILVTRNDPRTGLSNGDTGIVLPDAAGRRQVWFPELDDPERGLRLVAPARLPPHESFFAVTVHRAQGSEYDEVAVVPGPAESRVATRELLYTAITRARRRVIMYGSEESVRAAVGRATDRSSGLRDALDRPEPPEQGRDAPGDA